MTDIILPSLAGMARMSQIMVASNYTDTGANPANLEYTCPEGRLALITALTIQFRAGTAYVRMGFHVLKDGGGGSFNVFQRAAPAAPLTLDWTGSLWFTDADQLHSTAGGGGASSDYRVLVSGVEFDFFDTS